MGKKKNIPDRAKIEELMKVDGYSVGEIAFIYRCSTASIYARIGVLKKPSKKKPKKKISAAYREQFKSPNDSVKFTHVEADPYEHRDTGIGTGWMPSGVGGRIRQPKTVGLRLLMELGFKKGGRGDD